MKPTNDRKSCHSRRVSISSTDAASRIGSIVSRKLSSSLRRLRKRPLSYKGPNSPPLDISYPTSPVTSIFPSPESPMNKKFPDSTLTNSSLDMNWILEKLEESMRDHPDMPLTLSQPVISSIRSNRKEVLLEPLHAIFHEAPDDLVDTLCASIVAFNYLSSFPKYNNLNPECPSRHGTLDDLDEIPRRSSKRLGLRLSKASQLHIKDQIMQTRIASIQKHLLVVIDRLLVSFCGKSNYPLRSSIFVLIDTLEKKKCSQIVS